ncbi:hypothetical protein HPB51_006131 [Rhipicephalus microplus]|uniref:Secreted protein n=1 Tax=Rhipicephalus microplus TaxID=6941 RepID=A0A9J6ER58_RHIMP|nr:hypothetical protein HPB51_006131 [Rhipicephalus microplus]
MSLFHVFQVSLSLALSYGLSRANIAVGSATTWPFLHQLPLTLTSDGFFLGSSPGHYENANSQRTNPPKIVQWHFWWSIAYLSPNVWIPPLSLAFARLDAPPIGSLFPKGLTLLLLGTPLIGSPVNLHPFHCRPGPPPSYVASLSPHCDATWSALRHRTGKLRLRTAAFKLAPWHNAREIADSRRCAMISTGMQKLGAFFLF